MAYLPDIAIDRSHEITPSAFRLYAYYCKRRNSEGVCWPDLKTVARELNMSYSFASETRKQLIESGWISFDGRVITLLLGFGKTEPKFGKTETVSELPNNKVSGKPNLNSGKPNAISEFPNNSFGISELHIRKNQFKEPAQLTSPINQGGRERANAPTSPSVSRYRSGNQIAATPEAEARDRRLDEIQQILVEQYRLPIVGNERLYQNASAAIAEAVQPGGEREAVKMFLSQAKRPVSLRFFGEELAAFRAQQMNARA